MARFLLFIFVGALFLLALPAIAQVEPEQVASTELYTVRLEPIGPFSLEAGSDAPWWSFLVPVVGPIVSGLIAFGGVWLGLRTAQGNTRSTLKTAQRTSDASIWRQANETELRKIQAKIDGFFVPFQLLSKSNHQFAQDLRARESEGYRLLLKLFDKTWRERLPEGDKKLVEIVCSNAEDLRELIRLKSGLVDDKVLPYLSRARAHFQILNLAYKEELGTDPVRFENYVYPRQLDHVLALEIARLKSRIEELRANPGKAPEPLAPLEIPAELQLPAWVDPDGR